MRRLIALAAACVALLLLAGCWNRRELETLGIILAAGYDWDAEQQEYVVTAQIAKPQAMAGEGAGKGPTSHVFTARGKTVFEASRNLSRISTRKMWWGHVQVLVIGEEAAKLGLSGLLDFIERDGETRPLYFVVVTRGLARNLMHLRASPESVPAMGLTSLVKAAGATSTAPSARILDVSRALEAPSAALIGVVGVSEGEASDIGGPTKEFQLSGSAVFTKDKLVGFLDPQETRGALWVRSRVKSAILTVPCPGFPGRHVGVEVIHTASQIVPELDAEGRVRIRVSIRMEGNLGDQDCSFQYADLDKIEVLDKLVGARIRSEVEAARTACAKLSADCFGATDQVVRKFPVYWERKQKEIQAEGVPWPMLVEIEARVRGTGAQLKPTRPE